MAVKRLINAGLDRSSVTCILIGSYTYRRPWVRYEVMKSLRRGNRIFGVHINSIRGKDRLTKPLGPNPLKYLGVSFSDSGITRTLHEFQNGEWEEYDEIGGSSCYLGDPVAERYCGKGFKLSRWYPVYDWAADEGYINFAKWSG
jgi:hypothetical protein